jgi:hypothetical protein
LDYYISINAEIRASSSIAVNGVVDTSTPVSALIGIGEVSGTVLLTLVAGIVVTIRNNSAVALILSLVPSVRAQFYANLLC